LFALKKAIESNAARENSSPVLNVVPKLDGTDLINCHELPSLAETSTWSPARAHTLVRLAVTFLTALFAVPGGKDGNTKLVVPTLLTAMPHAVAANNEEDRLKQTEGDAWDMQFSVLFTGSNTFVHVEPPSYDSQTPELFRFILTASPSRSPTAR
jgi:hypothetical protein